MRPVLPLKSLNGCIHWKRQSTPGQQRSNGGRALQIQQALFKVETEIPDVGSDIVTGWREMRTHLHIGAAETPGPFREQLDRNAAMDAT